MQDTADSLRVEFLALAAEDRVSGRVRPLREYLAEFPGREELVARAWLGLFEAQDPGGPATEPTPSTAQGRRVGPYRLIEELGRGAQAIVWLAEDERMGRRVALKTVPRSPLFRTLAPRLEREARALARLQHPGISEVFDVGADEGVAWIAMRLEPGRTLADLIACGDAAARPREDVLGWIEGAARALHAAHLAGFLHRDVKPGNLLVRPDGTPVVLDFGVARDGGGAVALTLTGEAVGTPAYMAPEQLSRGHGPVDQRADVWSLGVTLHEALAGARPFAAATREAEVRRALSGEPSPLPPGAGAGVSAADLRTLLATALAKEPRQRYESAAALADDLARLRRGEPILARRPGLMRRLDLWARRRPLRAAGLLALVAFALVTAALLAQSRRQLRDFRRIADLSTARDLVAARASLLPLTAARAERAQRWVARANALLARERVHRATLATLPPRPDDAWSLEDRAGRLWMRAQLEQLMTTYDELRALLAWVAPRAEAAGEYGRRCAGSDAELWRAARARVAADPRLTGFELEPLPGLAPLGADPSSGLEEFAHLPSGAPATRDPVTGALHFDADTGVVLVLVPPGPTVVGASAPGRGEPNPDPYVGPYDGPPVRLRLAPFLVSKYELTQGQWERHTGTRDAHFQPGGEWTRVDGLLHPLENVEQARMATVLAELGLALPTEAQWEHAARAGSATPWHCGADPTLLDAYDNLADASVLRVPQGQMGWPVRGDLDDGYVCHAPVGRFRPNEWGLFDVHGNVAELTRSTWEDWSRHPPRDGDGSTEASYKLVTVRGGAFNMDVEWSRSSARYFGVPADVRTLQVGARPVMELSAPPAGR